MDIYRAAWLLPVDTPPVPDGALAVHEGRFVYVGPARHAPAGQRHDLGHVVLLPGLVNAHTHLELSAFKGQIPPRPLWDWFDELLRLISAVDFADAGPKSVRAGAAQSLAAGVTCVADISRTGLHVPVLAASALRKVCFLELISGARLPPFDPESITNMVDRFRPEMIERELMLGFAPHAPYTVQTDHLRAVAELARRHRLPVTLHALETADERDWFDGKPSRIADFLKASRPWLSMPASATGGLTALHRLARTD
jgi:cytosine/adenosine deaminase-related metal-dependent hydrolase